MPRVSRSRSTLHSAATRVDGNVVVVAIHTRPLTLGAMDILLSETRITGVALSCNAFPSVIAEMAAGTYPQEGWVETIPFSGIIDQDSSGCIGRKARKSWWT